MFKYLLWASVSGLVFFSGVHAWMYFGGSSSQEIVSGLWGWFGFTVFCSIFSAALRDAGFSTWCVVVITVGVCCVISVLGVQHLPWAIGVGMIYLGLLAWGAHEEHLDTVYDPNRGFVFVDDPKKGIVATSVPEGATFRQIRDEQRTLNAQRKRKALSEF